MTGIFGGIGPLQQGLNFHLERQNLIAGNIANLDTPGYAPKELERTESIKDSEFAMILRSTDSHHMTPMGETVSEASDPGFKVNEERVEIPGNDLNYVSMDHEMARLNANTLRYKVLGKLVTEQLGILRYAAQNGR